MQLYKIAISDAKELYTKLGCDSGGISILSKKSSLHTLYIKDLHVGAANILKQDALSIGADLAVPTGVIIAREKYVNAILIGTSKHFETLARKELAQPFGLKKLAQQLKSFINSKSYPTRIMGVLNANEDSFFKESRFSSFDAQEKIESMIQDGANIIDIGGVSSRPGSIAITAQEELDRVKPIIDLISREKLFEKVEFSLDSYQSDVLKYALDRGFSIVNDITGLQNDDVAKIAAQFNADVVIMHMQNDPTVMQNNPVYDDVILDIDTFFKERIEKAKDFGVNNIILDVGIGFGKTLQHNLLLLKNLEHFRHFGFELLIGASRKSMIDKIVPSLTEDRLPGTLAIHLESINKGASIVRCHDVKEHFQAIEVQKAIRNVNTL